jgi:hypothetical protein
MGVSELSPASLLLIVIYMQSMNAFYSLKDRCPWALVLPHLLCLVFLLFQSFSELMRFWVGEKAGYEQSAAGDWCRYGACRTGYKTREKIEVGTKGIIRRRNREKIQFPP